MELDRGKQWFCSEEEAQTCYGKQFQHIITNAKQKSVQVDFSFIKSYNIVVSQPAETEQARAFGEEGVATALNRSIEQLRADGIWVISVPTGGTLAMERGKEGAWVARTEGAFDSKTLKHFNEQVVYYNPLVLGDALEPPPASHWAYHNRVIEKMGPYYSPFTGLSRNQMTTLKDLPTVWQDAVRPRTLPEGNYPAKDLVADRQASLHYTFLLTFELVSGKYPKGIRLDSSEFVDERGVFPTVISAYIIPAIRDNAQLLAQEHGIPIEEALHQMIVLIPMGSDEKTRANAFFNSLAYLTGLSFVTVSANSSFGEPGGDAETNLEDSVEVARMIGEGKLPRGIAYDVGDAVVSTNLLAKTNPATRELQPTIVGTDSFIYGGTFFARHAAYLSELRQRQPQHISQREFPQMDLISQLGFQPSQESGFGYDDQNRTAYNASYLAQARASIWTTDPYSIPEKLPLGTRIVVVEAPGEGNGPAYAPRALRHTASQLWARTNGEVEPVIVVASECLLPNVSEDYAASLVSAIRHEGGITADRVVSAGSLSSIDVEEFLSLMLYWPFLQKDIDPSSADIDVYKPDPELIQLWLNEYNEARSTPIFG